MTKTQSPKLSLASPVTIPLDKLDIDAANVRKSEIDDAGIQDLAADIALRGLLQSLSVRPVLDADHEETGSYSVQAGGRRFRALKLLVKQKKLAKNAPIPCIVKTDGFAEADSLAENTQRQALTPLDEFRAFKAMADNGPRRRHHRRRLPRLCPRGPAAPAPCQCQPRHPQGLRRRRDDPRTVDGLLRHR